MTTVLVTGGAGFIGSHTVDLLLRQGYDVRVLDLLQDRVHPAGKPQWVPAEVDFVEGDVTDPSTLATAMRGVERVLHLAAHQDHQPEFRRFIHTNTESTASIFEIALSDPSAYPVEKVVIASSQAACGEGKYQCRAEGTVFWPRSRSREQLERAQWEHKCPRCGADADTLPMDEETCSSPTTAYGISKLAAEMLAFQLGRRHGIASGAMRYTHVQGSRNSPHNAYSGLARRAAALIQAGQRPIVYEDGGQLCDFVNVADVARANLVVLEDERADGLAFNVGGPRSVSVLEFVAIVSDFLGFSEDPEISGAFRVGDPRHMVSDTSRLRSLGWEPVVQPEQSATEYLEWLKGQTVSWQALAQAEQDLRAGGVVVDRG